MSGDALDFFEWREARTAVKKRPWMDEKGFVLGTAENLASIIDACIESGRYALDLETSGLDNRTYVAPGDPEKRLRTRDVIAGVVLCADGHTGYYIPIRHAKIKPDGTREPYAANVPLGLFDKEFRRLIQATDEGKTIAIFHHAEFDQEFLAFHGGEPYGLWDNAATWDDTLILAYLRNTRARRKGLKELSKAPTDADNLSVTGGPGLGMEMVEIHELWGHDTKQKHFNYDFSVLDPTDDGVLWYACGDGICTWLLYPLLAPIVLEKDAAKVSQKTIYRIEKMCVAATRWMQRNRIRVSPEKIEVLIKLGHVEWFQASSEVYTEASKILGRDVRPGYFRYLKDHFIEDNPKSLIPVQIHGAKGKATTLYPDPQGKITAKGADGKESEFPRVYDIQSPQQIGQMFDEMRVPGLKRTEKSNQVQTSKDELDRIENEAGKKFPFMGKIKRFRAVQQALGNYLYPMLLDSDSSDNSMRINFQAHKVDTGRFSTPSKDPNRSKKMYGWPQINLQSMPATYDPNRPACMTRLRECVVARDGSFIVAIDYAGEELRLVTNMSGEKLWLTEFFHCSQCDRAFDRGDGKSTPEAPPPRCPNCGSDKIGDLHTLTALAIFGQDARKRPDWKQKRQEGKITNFALSYGGGGMAVVRATGCSRNEGSRIKRQFDSTYTGLRSWWEDQWEFARKHGYVTTPFNRKYPVPDINHADGGWRSKAERNSVNGPIQGGGADVCKIAMALIYKEFKKRGWLDKARMIITMHDELVFEVDGDILEEMIAVTVPIMTSNPLILSMRWPVPLTTDVEIGTDWMVPWDLTSMRFDEVRFHGNEKVKDEAKATAKGYDWATLSSWPADLIPLFKEAQGQKPPTPSTIPPSQPQEAPKEGPPEPPAEPRAVGALTPSQARAQAHQALGVDTSLPVYEFRLRAKLSGASATLLAKVIQRCQHRGTQVLKLIAPDGTPINDDWRKVWLGGDEPVLVNSAEFIVRAKDEGLA